MADKQYSSYLFAYNTATIYRTSAGHHRRDYHGHRRY
jgi:hypothetical protein